MPGPRYVPRSFCEDPAAFGRDAGARWKRPASARAQIQARAARLQHEYVLRLRDRMGKSRMSAKAFASMASTTVQRLTRMMRGEIIMRLEDLAAADLFLGEVSEPSRRAAERDRMRSEAEEERVEAIVRATLAALAPGAGAGQSNDGASSQLAVSRDEA